MIEWRVPPRRSAAPDRPLLLNGVQPGTIQKNQPGTVQPGNCALKGALASFAPAAHETGGGLPNIPRTYGPASVPLPIYRLVDIMPSMRSSVSILRTGKHLQRTRSVTIRAQCVPSAYCRAAGAVFRAEQSAWLCPNGHIAKVRAGVRVTGKGAREK